MQGAGDARSLGSVRATAEQSAETAAAAPEALAAQLAAVASGLSQEQLKTLFLAILSGSPPAAPQHGAPRERQAGSSSALAQIPEDDLSSAFWVGEVDSRSQPADGRTQLVLVAGPYPDLTDALNSIPADRQVGAWQSCLRECRIDHWHGPVRRGLDSIGRKLAGGEDHSPAAAQLAGLANARQLLASDSPGRPRRACGLLGSAVCGCVAKPTCRPSAAKS